MFMAFTMPLSMGTSYYGSWQALDRNTREYFFENTIRNSWGQMGLTEEPADMEEVEIVLGKKTLHCLPDTGISPGKGNPLRRLRKLHASR